MRTTKQLLDECEQFEQQTDKWHYQRLGVITASRAKDFLAKKGTAARDGYMAELIAEICTGQRAEQFTNAACQWGIDHEDEARAAFEFETGLEVIELPFVKKDDLCRFGCSPDGLIGDNSGFEVKCPYTSKVFVEFAVNGKIKPEYMHQCQFSMWVTGRESWYFANFDPRMKAKKLFWVKVGRDEKAMKALDAAAESFITEMDEKLSKLGFKFGDQWVDNEQKTRLTNG